MDTTLIRQRAVPKEAAAYRLMRHQIENGLLPPGARIDRRAVAEQLGVSVQPVNLALARLEKERLVSVQSRHGSFVALLSLQNALESVFVWRALQSQFVYALAERRGVGIITTAERPIEEAKRRLESGNWRDAAALEEEFHRQLSHTSKFVNAIAMCSGARESARRCSGLGPVLTASDDEALDVVTQLVRVGARLLADIRSGAASAAMATVWEIASLLGAFIEARAIRFPASFTH